MVAKKDTVKATPKPREDPVARAERILAETKEKAKATAEKLLVNARKELDVAMANAEKWQGFVEQRQQKVNDLELAAGITTTEPNEGQPYAETLDIDEA